LGSIGLCYYHQQIPKTEYEAGKLSLRKPALCTWSTIPGLLRDKCVWNILVTQVGDNFLVTNVVIKQFFCDHEDKAGYSETILMQE
jgi:hypothetical protein